MASSQPLRVPSVYACIHILSYVKITECVCRLHHVKIYKFSISILYQMEKMEKMCKKKGNCRFFLNYIVTCRFFQRRDDAYEIDE